MRERGSLVLLYTYWASLAWRLEQFSSVSAAYYSDRVCEQRACGSGPQSRCPVPGIDKKWEKKTRLLLIRTWLTSSKNESRLSNSSTIVLLRQDRDLSIRASNKLDVIVCCWLDTRTLICHSLSEMSSAWISFRDFSDKRDRIHCPKSPNWLSIWEKGVKRGKKPR